MKNKYLHKLGCFVLAGSMMLSAAPVTYAADMGVQKVTEELTEVSAEDSSQAETTQTETSAPETDQTETDTSDSDQPQTKEPGTPAETETPVLNEPETADSSQTVESDASRNDSKENIPGIEDAGTSDNKKVVDIDDAGKEIQRPDDETVQIDHSDAAADYTSNIIAGNTVYLSELSSEYGLSFSDDFEKVMDRIEEDYRAFLDDPDAFTAENWQDVLAVYVMKYASGEKTVILDKSCQDELEQLFFLMNVRSNSAILRKLETVQEETSDSTEKTEKDTAETETTQKSESTAADAAAGVRSNRKAVSDTAQQGTVQHTANIKKAADAKETADAKEKQEKEYYALTAEEYAILYDVDEQQKAVLDKYASTKCRQLCAIVTASKGFVRSEAGSGVSEERVAIVAAACSLIGKVGYFWGGKSYAIGWDGRWGEQQTVSASGSKSSGTVRSYGLDCSGFVAWAYCNGLDGEDAGIGSHTTTQWNASEMVDSQDAQPGDLVFYRPGSAGDDNHVGIVVGVNDNGSLLVVHCSSGQNGVVTGEAWSSGFQYVRSPLNLK